VGVNLVVRKTTPLGFKSLTEVVVALSLSQAGLAGQIFQTPPEQSKENKESFR